MIQAILAASLMVLGLPVLVALFSIWKGWALSILWGWFIVPFFKLPELSIPQAIGIALVVSCLTYSTSNTNSKEKENNPFIMGIILPPLYLAVGWVVKQYL